LSDRNCPICGGSATWEQVPGKDEFVCTCPDCGQFQITGLKSQVLPVEIAQNVGLKAKLQKYIRSANLRSETPLLDAHAIDEALSCK